MRKSIGMLAATAAIMAFAATAALAHHGWTWAEEEQSELTGIVRTVTIAPPHPSLQVVEGSAKPGDEVVILGNRSLDQSEKRMKAVRITVNGKVFDIYPERIRTN
jgi:hypothetical protein